MKQLIILAAAATLVGCMEPNRGGAHYGAGRQTGSEASTNSWRSTSTNETSAAPTTSGKTVGSASSSEAGEGSVPSGPETTVDASTAVKTTR